MPPTFGELDVEAVVKALSLESFAQLFRQSAFLSAGVTEIQAVDQSRYFNKGEAVSIARPKDLGVAQDYDPRSGVDATTNDEEYVVITLLLNRLFTQGHRVYSSDANVERYIRDFGDVTGGAIRRSVDDYLYDVGFRSWNLPSTGAVGIAGHPPVAIVANETSGGALTSFDKRLLINAGKVLDSRDVPSTNRVARLGTSAKADFLGDSVMVEGYAGAIAPSSPGAGLVSYGIPMEKQVERYGFVCRGSNAITGQSAVTDLGDGTATDTISAVVDDTTIFFEEDQATSTPLGAVQLTLGVTAALDVGVAVGKIARLGPDAAAATAYGVILRVDAANKYVWLVPYSLTGEKLTATDIAIATDKFGIPAISEISTASHTEHLCYASRLLRVPSDGSGAVAGSTVDMDSGLVLQVFKGSYNVNRFNESIRSSCLFGATPTDWRKGCLILT